MSTSLKIKKAANKQEISILRRFGHRVFVEISEDEQHIGYFVQEHDEFQPVTATAIMRNFTPAQSGVVRKRRHPISPATRLVWKNTNSKPLFEAGSYREAIAACTRDFTLTPQTRADIVAHVFKETKHNISTISAAVSCLMQDGYLLIYTGEE